MVSLPKGLVDSIANRELVLFVGNGFSCYVDPALPGWGPFLRRLANDSSFSESERSQIDTLQTRGGFSLYQAADFIEKRLGPKLPPLISKILQTSPSNRLRAERLHRIPSEFIITTNFDDFIENSAGELFNPPGFRVMSVDELPKALDLIRSRSVRFLLKTHVMKSKDVVLSQGAYYELLSRLDYTALMHSVFCNYVVLFLGYGLDDLDFNYFYGTIGRLMSETSKTHFALMRSTTDIQRETFRRYGIEVIQGELDQFFDAADREVSRLKSETPDATIETRFSGTGGRTAALLTVDEFRQHIDFKSTRLYGPTDVAAGSIVATDWVVYHLGTGSVEVALDEGQNVLRLERSAQSNANLSVRFPVGPRRILKARTVRLELKTNGPIEFFVLQRFGSTFRYVALTTEPAKENLQRDSDGLHDYFFFKLAQPKPDRYEELILSLEDPQLPKEFTGADEIVGLFFSTGQFASLKSITLDR